VRISWHESDRAALRPLFSLAESSTQRLDAYLDAGSVLVAAEGAELLGYLQLVERDEDEIELKSMAVASARQRRGIGSALIDRAVTESRETGFRTMVVATAAADTGDLRFYQRNGFRLLRVERDAFTAEDGYPEELTIDGIPLRDRVWLSLALEH
jgi:ribosomal protein S18 acetylase RimI-like enzyme